MPQPPIEFIHELRFDGLPDEVAAFARRSVLDLIGVAAGAIGTDLSRIIRNHAFRQFGAGGRPARMLFDGRPVSPAGAALAGGMTIDALDAHDGHKLTKGHAGCGVLPAALALAESEGQNDDRDFLTAVALGYEIGTRAGMALHRTACDYHTSGAWVALAAAALGARALRLDAARTREALGIAEYHGPRSQMMRCIDHPTMVKDGSGWGAMAGVSAAYLAADGFTGAPALTVEGDDVADLWTDLGARWRLLEQYYKPFPVCRWAQPAVQAVLDLRAEHGLTSDMVETLEITTFHEARRLAVTRPATTEQAQYSTAFPVAAALVRGLVGPDEVSRDAFHDPEIARIAGALSIEECDEYNDVFPARRFAHVNIRLNDGRSLASPRTEASGDPEAPTSDETVRAKFRSYSAPVLGEERSERIASLTDALGRGDGAAAFFDAILAPVGVRDPSRQGALT